MKSRIWTGGILAVSFAALTAAIPDPARAQDSASVQTAPAADPLSAAFAALTEGPDRLTVTFDSHTPGTPGGADTYSGVRIDTPGGTIAMESLRIEGLDPEAIRAIRASYEGSAAGGADMRRLTGPVEARGVVVTATGGSGGVSAARIVFGGLSMKPRPDISPIPDENPVMALREGLKRAAAFVTAAEVGTLEIEALDVTQASGGRTGFGRFVFGGYRNGVLGTSRLDGLTITVPDGTLTIASASHGGACIEALVEPFARGEFPEPSSVPAASSGDLTMENLAFDGREGSVRLARAVLGGFGFAVQQSVPLSDFEGLDEEALAARALRAFIAQVPGLLGNESSVSGLDVRVPEAALVAKADLMRLGASHGLSWDGAELSGVDVSADFGRGSLARAVWRGIDLNPLLQSPAFAEAVAAFSLTGRRLSLPYTAEGLLTIRGGEIAGLRLDSSFGLLALDRAALAEVPFVWFLPKLVEGEIAGLRIEPRGGPPAAAFLRAGLQSLDLNASLRFVFDEASRTASVERLSVSEAALGSLDASLRLGGVDAKGIVDAIEQGAVPPPPVLEAAEATLVSRRLVEVALALAAQERGSTPAALRAEAEAVAAAAVEALRASGGRALAAAEALLAFVKAPGTLKMSVDPEPSLALDEAQGLAADPSAAAERLRLSVTATPP